MPPDATPSVRTSHDGRPPLFGNRMPPSSNDRVLPACNFVETMAPLPPAHRRLRVPTRSVLSGWQCGRWGESRGLMRRELGHQSPLYLSYPFDSLPARAQLDSTIQNSMLVLIFFSGNCYHWLDWREKMQSILAFQAMQILSEVSSIGTN